MQQAKKWCSDSTSGWRVTHMLKQIDDLVNYWIVNLNLTFKRISYTHFIRGFVEASITWE